MLQLILLCRILMNSWMPFQVLIFILHYFKDKSTWAGHTNTSVKNTIQVKKKKKQKVQNMKLSELCINAKHNIWLFHGKETIIFSWILPAADRIFMTMQNPLPLQTIASHCFLLQPEEFQPRGACPGLYLGEHLEEVDRQLSPISLCSQEMGVPGNSGQLHAHEKCWNVGAVLKQTLLYSVFPLWIVLLCYLKSWTIHSSH